MFQKLLLMYVVTATLSLGSSKQPDVYVCKSDTGSRYHLNKDCHGLKRCKHQIEKMSINKAKKIGRTICGYED